MASAGAIRMGQAFVELFTDKRRLVSGLKSAEKDFKEWGKGIRNVGVGMSAASGAILAPMALSTVAFANAGSELNDMAARTGASVEALSLLKFAAEQTGADFSAVGVGVKGLDNKLTDAVNGNATAAASFATLGLSAGTLINLPLEEQLALIADGLQRVQNPAMRASIAQDLFGKSGMALLPMLKDGGQALRNQFARGMQVGAGWTTAMADSADALGDRLDELKTAGNSVTYAIGGALAPAIMEMTEPLFGLVAGTRDWISANPEVVQTVAMVAAGVGAAGLALAGLGITVSTVGMGLGALGAAASFVVSPIGLLTAAAGTIGYVLVTETNVGIDAFNALSSTATTAWGGISDAISSGDIALAGEIAIAGLNVVWQEGIRVLQDEWVIVSTFVMQTWNDTTAFMATIGENYAAAMSSIWIDIKGMAFNAMNAIASKWDSVSGGIADLIIDAGVSSGFIKGNAEEIKKARREDTERRQVARESAMATAGDTRAKQKAEIEANRVAGIGGIQAEQQQKNEELAAGQDAAIMANEKAKNEAQEKLAALRAKAGEKVVAVAKDRKTKAKTASELNAEAIAAEKFVAGEATTSGVVSSMHKAMAIGMSGLASPDTSTPITGGMPPSTSSVVGDNTSDMLLSHISETLDSIDQRVAAGGALVA